MRFLITVAPDPNRPQAAAAPPDEKLLAAYMKFNEDMHRAGVLVTSEGLHPESQGVRVGVSGDKRVVIDGPFAETKELVGGLYLIDVASREEAIQWALRCPVGMGSADVLTIHRMTALADLPPEVLRTIREAAPTWSAVVEREESRRSAAKA